jgi:hypothetical protein
MNNKVAQAQEALDAAILRQNKCSDLLNKRVVLWDDAVTVRVVIDSNEVTCSARVLASALSTQLKEHQAAVMAAQEELRLAVKEWSEELGS